jgi:hypothetical protein
MRKEGTQPLADGEAVLRESIAFFSGYVLEKMM